jgi:hypothetical protein
LVVWVIGLVWLGIYMADTGSRLAAAALFLWFVIPCGLVIDADMEKPCVQYETRMQYNPATKTVMPLRVCTQYGEWVEDDPQ